MMDLGWSKLVVQGVSLLVAVRCCFYGFGIRWVRCIVGGAVMEVSGSGGVFPPGGCLWLLSLWRSRRAERERGPHWKPLLQIWRPEYRDFFLFPCGKFCMSLFCGRFRSEEEDGSLSNGSA